MFIRKDVLVAVLVYVEAVFCVIHPDGVSKVSGYQDDRGNFQFGYTVSSVDGEHFHKADKDATGRVIGSYGLTESDGRQRVVDYIADQGGFRAHIRSNEPGLASARSAAVTIEKTGSDAGSAHLDIAASDTASRTSSASSFGDRIKETSSRVAYARPFEDERYRPRRPLRPLTIEGPVDRSSAEESQDRGLDIRRNGRLSSGSQQPALEDTPVRESEEVPEPAADDVVSRVYQPPLNPFNVVRPEVEFGSRRVATSIARPLLIRTPQPSTPPYGGFETREPFHFSSENTISRFPGGTPYALPPTDEPGVSMSTVHGGFGNMQYLPRVPPGLTRSPNPLPYPQGRPPLQPVLPVVSDVEGRRVPGSPNLVFRAMVIPNGIQAIPIDPSTGQVQNVPRYPIYDPKKFPRDGRGLETGYFPHHSVPDKNIGYNLRDYDRPGFRRPPRPFDREAVGPPRAGRAPSFDGHPNRLNHLPDQTSLSRPSAQDLALISEIVEQVNRNRGIQQPPYPNAFPRRPSFFSGPRPDYPPQTGFGSTHTYFDDDFPNLRPDIGPGRSNFGPFSRTLLDQDYEGPDPRFEEPRYSRGYRSIDSEDDSKSDSDTRSSSAETIKEDDHRDSSSGTAVNSRSS